MLSKRWHVYVLAMALAIAGLALLTHPQIALAAGPDGGAVNVYVYHDVNEDGIWNWGEVAPPNTRGDYAWQWDFPCTHPETVCEMAEIGLVGAEVVATYHGGDVYYAKTAHNGPAEFGLPVGAQIVDVGVLGTGDGRAWRVTNVSQKTVNPPANSQFEFNFPLPPAGPDSIQVVLVGVVEGEMVDCDCDAEAATADATAEAAPVAAAPKESDKYGGVNVYVYHDVNEDGIWNWGTVAPPNTRGDYAWQWDFPCTHPETVCEMAEIALVGAEVAATYHGGQVYHAKTAHNGPAEFGLPVGAQVVDVNVLGTGDGRAWRVTNVSQKTVNEPADAQFAFNFPLAPAGPDSLQVLLVGVAEDDNGADDGATTYTIQPGDTLSGIAKAFGTTVEALASANGIANPNLIYAGSLITIP